ncbi:MAG TPA: acetylxylan esterase [Chryseosolibacter sp.]
MNRKNKFLLSAMAFVFLSGVLSGANHALGQTPGERPRPVLPPIPIKGDTTHTLSKHFILTPEAKKAPDANGFIQRWLVLEPVKKDIARNNILTEAYLRSTFSKDNFSTDFSELPRNGKKVKVGGQELTWYALDSKVYNFNLYHFTYAINKPRYGVLFWLVTAINSPEEIRNVRMAAGANSGGMFWLNGKEALMLSGDRDMIVDNVTSPLLTIKKGRNIIRGAVINGPGMCNFALRFLDEKGSPVKNLTISYE